MTINKAHEILEMANIRYIHTLGSSLWERERWNGAFWEKWDDPCTFMDEKQAITAMLMEAENLTQGAPQ